MAAPDGKIEVELKLLLEAAQKQAATFAAKMKKDFDDAAKASPMSKMAADADKAAASENKATAAIKERTRATKALSDAQQRLRDIASGKLSPVAPGQRVSDISMGTSTGTPGFVSSPRIGIPQLPGQAFPNLPFGGYSGPKSAGAAGAGMKQYLPMLAAAVGTGVGGPLGGAIAGVLTKMNPAVAATTAAITALRYAAQKVTEAYDRAASLYARNLSRGGLGQNFVTRQNILAGVIGVSEQDVMQYGNQIAVLNQKLQVAIRTISDAQPTLTATAWNFRVLKENLSALWANVAEALAPAINRITELLSALTKLSILSGLATMVGTALEVLIELMTRMVAVTQIAVSAIMTMMTAIKDAFIWNFHPSHGFKDTKAAFESLKEVLKAAFAMDNKYRQTAPNVGSNINRLPGSSWEHMGMVIGQTGGGTNWNQKTAQGVAQLVSLTQKMVNAVSNGNSGSFSNPNAAMP